MTWYFAIATNLIQLKNYTFYTFYYAPLEFWNTMIILVIVTQLFLNLQYYMFKTRSMESMLYHGEVTQ